MSNMLDLYNLDGHRPFYCQLPSSRAWRRLADDNCNFSCQEAGCFQIQDRGRCGHELWANASPLNQKRHRLSSSGQEMRRKAHQQRTHREQGCWIARANILVKLHSRFDARF